MPLRPFNGAGLELIKWLTQNYAIVTELYPLIAEFRAITDPPDSAAGLRARVKLALKAAQIIASHTPGEIDDKILAAVNPVLTNEAVLAIVVQIIQHFEAQTPPPLPTDNADTSDADAGWQSPVKLKAMSAGVPEHLKAKAVSLGFPDMSQLMAIVKLIMQLIEMFKGK